MALIRRRQAEDAPCEGHPHLGQEERARTDWSVVKILAVLAAFIAFGLFYYVKDREMVSSDGTVVKTTGSAPAYQRDPNENRPVSPPDRNDIRANPPPREPVAPVQRAPAPPAQQ
jgi:hypothetical protein